MKAGSLFECASNTRKIPVAFCRQKTVFQVLRSQCKRFIDNWRNDPCIIGKTTLRIAAASAQKALGSQDPWNGT